MFQTSPSPTTPTPSRLDRALSLFTDVRAGEGATALLMLVNIFLLLVCYSVVKTVREPLILLGGGAEVRSYAAAGQALRAHRLRPAVQRLCRAGQPREAADWRHAVLHRRPRAVHARGDGARAVRRRRVFHLGRHLQRLPHRAVLVVRQRSLHEGSGRPALSDRRGRHDGRRAARLVHRRPAVPCGLCAASHPPDRRGAADGERLHLRLDQQPRRAPGPCAARDGIGGRRVSPRAPQPVSPSDRGFDRAAQPGQHHRRVPRRAAADDARRRARGGASRVQQAGLHRRVQRRLPVLGERHRVRPAGARHLPPREVCGARGCAARTAAHRARWLRDHLGRRRLLRGPLDQDRRKRDGLLDHEHRPPAALAANQP